MSGSADGAPAMEQLGSARMFGRHLVIRNQISSGEANCLERSLDAREPPVAPRAP